LHVRLLVRRPEAGGDESIPWFEEDLTAMFRTCSVLGEFDRAVTRVSLPASVPKDAARAVFAAAERCRTVIENIQMLKVKLDELEPVNADAAHAAAESLVESCLLSMQGLVKLEKVSGVTDRVHQWSVVSSKLGLERSCLALREVLKYSQALAKSVRVSLALLVKQQLFVAWRWLVESVTEWTSLVKFGHVFLGLAASLLQKGFCGKKEEEDNGNQDGEFEFDDDIEGTGMGEGQGKNDVSKQIEDAEEQLMGTTNEKKDERDEPDEKEEDDAIDMELDFDGNLHDMDGDDEQEGDDEDKDNPDREMGDEKQEDVIDEKMWDDPSDEEGDGEDADGNRKETFEKDDPLKMQKGMELELAAKQQGDEDDDKQMDEEQNNEQDDEKEQDDQNDDDDKGEQRALEDEVVDKQADVQEQEEFQMPPDAMDMSSEEPEGDGGKEEEEGGGAEGEDQAEPMELSADESEVEGGEEEENVGPDPDGVDKEAMAEPEKEDEEEQQKQQGKDGDQEEEPLPEEAEKKEDEEEDNDHNPSAKERENHREDDEAKWGVRERGAGAVEIKGTGETKGDKDEQEKEKKEGEQGSKQGDDKQEEEEQGQGEGGDQGDGGDGQAMQGHGLQKVMVSFWCGFCSKKKKQQQQHQQKQKRLKSRPNQRLVRILFAVLEMRCASFVARWPRKTARSKILGRNLCKILMLQPKIRKLSLLMTVLSRPLEMQRKTRSKSTRFMMTKTMMRTTCSPWRKVTMRMTTTWWERLKLSRRRRCLKLKKRLGSKLQAK
jgi:hypothetical protein